jgi:hypothetical protein
MVLVKFANDKGKAAKIRFIEARQISTLIICAATFNIMLQRRSGENRGKADCDNCRYVTRILKVKN